MSPVKEVYANPKHRIGTPREVLSKTPKEELPFLPTAEENLLILSIIKLVKMRLDDTEHEKAKFRREVVRNSRAWSDRKLLNKYGSVISGFKPSDDDFI